MTHKNKILFVIGSVNQTSQMHQIALCLPECDCFFTQYFGDHPIIRYATEKGWMDNTIMGKGRFKQMSDAYLSKHGLQNDYRGEQLGNKYDLVVLCTDMTVPKIARNTKSLWVQEGMIDQKTWRSKLVKALRLPAFWTADTSLNGSSNLCDIYCAASEGYRNYFAQMGTDPHKIVVTGIPNFDNAARLLQSRFPISGYVMVATSDIRETYRSDDREGFLQRAVQIANGRQLLFKLHPNENYDIATAEIRRIAPPNALIYQEGNTDEMIAHCDELITQWSTVVYTGIALGKKVHSYFDLDRLYELAPVQNGGQSAKNIADICRAYLAHQGSKETFRDQVLPIFTFEHQVHSHPTRPSTQTITLPPFERVAQYFANNSLFGTKKVQQ